MPCCGLWALPARTLMPGCLRFHWVRPTPCPAMHCVLFQRANDRSAPISETTPLPSIRLAPLPPESKAGTALGAAADIPFSPRVRLGRDTPCFT